MAYDQRRLELHQIFETILGSSNVYFQPPESKEIIYPCIIYERSTGDSQYADNIAYKFRWCYSVTLISRDPDTDIPDRIAMLPLCRADRMYQADNLNHYAFTLYY